MSRLQAMLMGFGAGWLTAHVMGRALALTSIDAVMAIFLSVWALTWVACARAPGPLRAWARALSVVGACGVIAPAAAVLAAAAHYEPTSAKVLGVVLYGGTFTPAHMVVSAMLGLALGPVVASIYRSERQKADKVRDSRPDPLGYMDGLGSR